MADAYKNSVDVDLTAAESSDESDPSIGECSGSVAVLEDWEKERFLGIQRYKNGEEDFFWLNYSQLTSSSEEDENSIAEPELDIEHAGNAKKSSVSPLSFDDCTGEEQSLSGDSWYDQRNW